ncbi:hypothetical protein RF11_05983 [Thelohanellus kitauei]|uniref:Uncharacterized protein n=1 Tax=Thelohanellus kitauei TaxID=669202 RepID=A0A0C2MCX7_THEKT|nr:hypothetical protein RF11_05983 [Thelohanellus kitauei]
MRGFNYQTVKDLGSETRFDVCQDKQEKLKYVRASDPKDFGKNPSLFLINTKTMKFYKIYISAGNNNRSVNISKIWCSSGHLALYEEKTHKFIMRFTSKGKFIEFDFTGPLDNAYLDDAEQNNIAVVTKNKKVRNRNISSCISSYQNLNNGN